jgi:branched-chain amino acid transport system substrate-binding protein
MNRFLCRSAARAPYEKMECAGAECAGVIGADLPLTGQNAFGGQLELEGVQMAHKEMGEVLGKKVELFVVDNKSDKVESPNAVKRLIEKEKVVAIIGTYGSSLAMAGGEVSEKAGVPRSAPAAPTRWSPRARSTSSASASSTPSRAPAQPPMPSRPGPQESAALDRRGQRLRRRAGQLFQASFTKLGGEVVATLNYQSGDQDFTAQLQEIMSKQPDMLFIPSYFAEGAIIMKQAQELGAKFQIMGGDAMDNPEITAIGGSAWKASFTPPSPTIRPCPT